MKKRYFIVLALMTGASVYAKPMKMMVPEGGRVGNGGGLVVCRNPADHAIRSVELIDYYEARTRRKLTLDLESLTGSWKERAQQLISRLSKLSPMRVDIYSKWLETFEKEAVFVKDSQFTTIPDTGFIAIPNGCEFEQGVVQLKPRFSDDYRYSVNLTLWEAMDDSQRAGLVLHEFLYREAIGYGHTDSISVRYINGTIADSKFAAMEESNWISLLTQAKYEMTDIVSNTPDLKIEMEIERIWQPAPEEKVTAIRLQRRIPILLGLCSKNGCDNFSTVASNQIITIGQGETLLHPMITTMKYQAYQFYRSYVGDLENIVTSLGSKDGKLTYLGWLSQKPGKYKQASFYFQNKELNVSGEATRLSFENDQLSSMQAYEFSLLDQGIYESNGQLTTALWFKGNHFDYLRVDSLPTLEGTRGWISSKIPGGSIWLLGENIRDELNFDSSGHYLRGGRVGDFSFSKEFKIEYTCMASRTACASKAGDLSQAKLSQIYIEDALRYIAQTVPPKLGSAQLNSSVAILVPSQFVELHPNGRLKHGNISSGILYKRDQSILSIHEVQAVDLDEDGYLL